jgi:hypothetical protein
MQRKEKNIYRIIGIALIVTVAGYFLLMDSFTEWNLNLDKSKKNAYGTYLTYELLKKKYKEQGFTEIKQSVTESLQELDSNNSYTYIFINNFAYYDSAATVALYQFAEKGNTVLISCEGLSDVFLDTILKKSYHLNITTAYNELYYSNFKFDSLNEFKRHETFNFYHPELNDKSGYTYYLKNKADTITHYFNIFRPLPDSERIQPIPDNNTLISAGYEITNGENLNFAILKHGKGQLIILLSAVPFTNYFMRTGKGLEYAEKIIAHLPEQPVLWDDVSHIYVPEERARYRGDSSFNESPLYFILNQPALRWAWYLTILGVVIYGIFHAKRRQAIIPLIEPKENTSLKYVETIGQLYFQEEEHIEIAHEMQLQFLNFIRRNYFLKTTELDDAFYTLLAQKSAVEFDKIKKLFEFFKAIFKSKHITRQQLHQLNEQLEYFYNHCK